MQQNVQVFRSSSKRSEQSFHLLVCCKCFSSSRPAKASHRRTNFRLNVTEMLKIIKKFLPLNLNLFIRVVLVSSAFLISYACFFIPFYKAPWIGEYKATSYEMHHDNWWQWAKLIDVNVCKFLLLKSGMYAKDGVAVWCCSCLCRCVKKRKRIS